MASFLLPLVGGAILVVVIVGVIFWVPMTREANRHE